jgi:hypothetical protein
VAAELTEQQARAIEHSAQQWMQQHDAPSVSIAVVLDGQLVWERAFGVADAERNTPATPATVYRLASVTKSMRRPPSCSWSSKGRSISMRRYSATALSILRSSGPSLRDALWRTSRV